MKRLLSTLLLALLAACSSYPADTDAVSSGVRAPDVAAANAYLAARLDPGLPVVLTEGRLLERGLLGMTQKFPDHYLITLDSRLDQWERQMVLIHEWAHVLVWDSGLEPEDQHGKEWGEQYSRVFKVWLGG